MNDTQSAPESDGAEGAKTTSLANPRRTRVGADGRPIVGQVSSATNG